MSTWIVCKLAIVIGAKVTGLAWVVVAVAIAAVVDNADVVAIVACWLAFNAVVIIVSAVVVAVCCLDVTVRGGVVILGNLCLLWLHHQHHITVSYS